jgi:O-methyltransferase
MKLTRPKDQRSLSLVCALLRREDVVADEGEGAAGLWAMADLATPMAVRVAATLRIADHITRGRQTAPELAEAVRADAGALGRVLRHLVSAGVLRRDQSDRYVLTARGEALRDDHPAGMRAMLDLDSAIGRADLSFVQLLHTVRTGEPAFPAQFGRSFWDDLAADPTRSASFDAQMAADVAAWAPDIVAAYDWGSLGHVVDVGGGNGALLIAMLHRYPDLRGTVLDLPGAAETARKALTAAGLADRSDAMAGSFFDPLPPAAGGYLLCAVLHDWDDAPARAILRRCAEAAGTGGRVFVVEKLVTDTDHRTEMDLRVLAYFGGRERGIAEFTALAAAAGLRVAAVHPAGATPVVELTAL